MKKSRIKTSDIQRYDRENNTSNVRELEMLVDGCGVTQGYILQFWRDMTLYGLREAIMYLSCHTKDTARIEAFAALMTAKLQK